ITSDAIQRNDVRLLATFFLMTIDITPKATSSDSTPNTFDVVIEGSINRNTPCNKYRTGPSTKACPCMPSHTTSPLWLQHGQVTRVANIVHKHHQINCCHENAKTRCDTQQGFRPNDLATCGFQR